MSDMDAMDTFNNVLDRLIEAREGLAIAISERDKARGDIARLMKENRERLMKDVAAVPAGPSEKTWYSKQGTIKP